MALNEIVGALGALLPAVATVLKVLWGLDKPGTHEVKNEKQPVRTSDDDDALVDDLRKLHDRSSKAD